MINETNTPQTYSTSKAVATPNYAPAPKKGCDCPEDAPCRLSGICTCDLVALTNQLKRESETSEKR
jgi:hypothetical protein